MIAFSLAIYFLFLFFIVGNAANLHTNEVVDRTYSEKDATIALYLSCATFCDPETYESRVYPGVINGLNVTLTIHDNKYQTSGFVGVLPSSNSIYIAYRGSSNWQNWMANLETSMTPYTSFPNGECKGCSVHRGFYAALLADFDAVAAEVRRLLKLFPTYKVKTTGHSLGAALSQLAGMELIARDIPVFSTYNFGQPR